MLLHSCNTGISAAVSKICRERKGRDVYVVGAANVGKSAFVRAMLKEMSKFEGGNYDAAAMAHSKYLPVESAMPGTTLGLIPLQAFETGGVLYGKHIICHVGVGLVSNNNLKLSTDKAKCFMLLLLNSPYKHSVTAKLAAQGCDQNCDDMTSCAYD